jgi:hypothetical protein
MGGFTTSDAIVSIT